jgi:hypothetical protein
MTRANSAGDCFPKPITYPHLQILHLAQLAQHSPRSGPKKIDSFFSALAGLPVNQTLDCSNHPTPTHYCEIQYILTVQLLYILVHLHHHVVYFHCGIIDPAPGTVPFFLQFALPHCQDPRPSGGTGRRINQWADECLGE